MSRKGDLGRHEAETFSSDDVTNAASVKHTHVTVTSIGTVEGARAVPIYLTLLPIIAG